MTDTPISALPSATTPLTGAEIYYAVQGGIDTQLTGVQLNAYAYNADPRKFYNLRAALARAATGGAFVKVALLGDSQTNGYGADVSQANWRKSSWPAQLATQLAALGIPACQTNAFGNATKTLNVQPNQADGRLTQSGGFATLADTLYMLGGCAFSNYASAGTLSFSPGVSTDTVDLYWVDTPASQFTVNIGGATLFTGTGVGTGGRPYRRV